MNDLSPYQVDLIEVLVDSKALAFGEFTLKSGRKSPYFFNMGMAVSKGKYLDRISRCYCDKIMDAIGGDFSFIFGPAYKGIPLACSIAQSFSLYHDMDRRWGYDRKESKEYGDARDKVLVGELVDGDGVIMVDDVVTTGGTKIEGWNKIVGLAKGLELKGIFVAVDREEKDECGRMPKEIFKKSGMELYSILSATEIFEYLHEYKVCGKMMVDDDVYQRFKEYKERY